MWAPLRKLFAPSGFPSWLRAWTQDMRNCGVSKNVVYGCSFRYSISRKKRIVSPNVVIKY